MISMIEEGIKKHFSHHLEVKGRLTTKQSMYVADYNKQTGSKEGVKLFDTPPKEIKCFILNNPHGIEITGQPFDNESFKSEGGKPESQCECVIYPEKNDEESWICFIETKYCDHRRNFGHMKKALEQLTKTQEYYRNKGVFGEKNTCYLFASLPLHNEPFLSEKLADEFQKQTGVELPKSTASQESRQGRTFVYDNFRVPASTLTKTKRESKAIIIYTNSVDIFDDKILRYKSSLTKEKSIQSSPS